LDDGKIFTGNPFFFDGKKAWVSGVDFPSQVRQVRGEGELGPQQVRQDLVIQAK
jgi:hypothetical protein